MNNETEPATTLLITIPHIRHIFLLSLLRHSLRRGRSSMCRRRREGLNPSSILLFHRLANHPALRASNPRTSDPLTKLRKSRSEMGTGFVLGSASSRSSPSSQIPQQPTPEFGYRTVALQKAREAQSKMKRSRTINFQQFYTSASSPGTASVGSGNATYAAAGGHRSVPPPSAGRVTKTYFCVGSFDGFLDSSSKSKA